VASIYTNKTTGMNQVDNEVVTFAVPTFVDVASGGTLKMTGSISGTGFNKAGGGTLILSGVNELVNTPTPDGLIDGTYLMGGTLVLNNNQALGTGDLDIEGGTLQSGAAPGTVITLANNVTVEKTGSISGSQDFDFTGTWHILSGQTLTVNNSAGTDF